MNENRTKNMTEGNPARLLLAFALPMMLGNVFQQMYTMVDTMIVGKGVGVNALASLGAADWFCWMFISLAAGLTQGFGILMSQNFGAGDTIVLKRTTGISITLTIWAAGLFTLCAELMIRPMLHLMNTDPLIFGGSERYLRIMFGGIPIILAYNMAATMLRSLGDSKTPLNAMVVASVLNIGLDLLFVMVLKFGITGAASATLIAQLVSFVYCLLRIRTMEELKLSREDLQLQRGTVVQLLKLGTPVMAQNVIISVGGMVVMSVVNVNGVLFVAGYTATNKLYGLLEMAAVSVGYAMLTYTGQNLGAGKTTRIRSGIRSAAIMAGLMSFAVSVLMLIFGKPILRCFISADPEEAAIVLGYGYEYLKILATYLFILYMLYAYRSALQGLGNTVIPMISGLSEFVMRVGAAVFLPAIIGHCGVFYAEVLAWLGAAVILVTAFYLNMHKLEKRQDLTKGV